MAKNDLNDITEGLRRLDEYEQKLRRIESLAKSIAATLNSAGANKAGMVGDLSVLQNLRLEAQTGAVIGANPQVGSAMAGIYGGNPTAGAGGGVSVFLLNSLENARQRQQPTNPLNPFANAPASGPSSTIGTPGYGMNSWYFQQQQARQTQRQIAVGAGGYAAGHFINAGLNVYANNTVGDYDPMAGAGAWGGLIGGTLGGITGAALSPFAPGAGAATGILAGQMIGASSAQGIMAGYVRQRDAELSLQSIAARQGASIESLSGDRAGYLGVSITGGAFRPSAKFSSEYERHVAGELDTMQHDISFQGKNPMQVASIKTGIYAGRDIISLKQISDVYATLGSALLSSGEDSAGSLTFTRNLASKYYMGSPAMARLAAPVMANKNRFGGNDTDLLLNFGAEAYGAYQDATGGRDITPRQLTAVGNIQKQQHKGRVASLQARGAAAGSLEAVNAEMQELSMLPGGKGSLAFAEASAQARGLGFQAFNDEQTTEFSIPHTRLQGEMTRANLLPFGSSNRLGLQFQNIGMLRGRVSSLTGFMNRRRASGELSEQEELGLTQEIEQAKTGIAGSIATLAEGRENMLPAMTAGRTRFSGRFSSTSLAAFSLQRNGSPVRSYGAMNGGQLAEQDAFLEAAGGSEFRQPWSRSAGLNGGGGGKEVVAAIERLTKTIEQFWGGGSRGSTRPGESAAMTQGMLSRRDLGTGALNNGAN